MSSTRRNGAHRNRLCIIAIAAAGTASPLAAAAQVDGDFRAGVNIDADLMTIGGGVLLDLERRGGWYFNPNVEAGISDEDDLLSMNGDFHYDFESTRGASLYLGAGPVLVSRREQSDFGLNLLAGLAGRHGRVRPFAQLKGVVADRDELVLMGGVRF
jgi:hypothetical protein